MPTGYDINRYNNLRQAILDKITSGETTIQEAHFEQVSQFEGSPAAVIGVSNNEALYSSNRMDRMTFVFQIMIYIPITPDTDTHQVEINMGQAYWETLNLFQNREALPGNADMVEPMPSVWGYELHGEGLYRFSQINLRCVVFLNNS